MSDEQITHDEAKNARVPTELHCPMCKTLHVDQDEWAHEIPHRKHLCAGCHHIWQPYAVGTVGVDLHVQCRAAREAADLCVAELRRQVNERLAEQEKIQKLEHDLAWTRAEWSAAGDEIAKLTAHNEQMAEAYAAETGKLEARRDELLAMVAKLSQTVPLESEVAEALDQRGALLAEVGTLRARVTELEARLNARSA